MTRLRALSPIAAVVMLATIGSSPAARARENFLKPLEGAPPLAQATVPDRPPSDAEAWGTLMKGTNFSVSGAKTNRSSFALGAIGGLVGFNAQQGKNRERGATAADAFTQIDLRSLLRELSGSADAVRANGGGKYELVPVVLATFSDDTHFEFTCIINVSLRSDGQRAWRGRSLAFPSPGPYDASSPESLDAASAQVAPCIREAYGALSQYLDDYDRFRPPRRYLIGSTTVDSPILPDGLPDRHVVNDLFGVVSYPSTSVKLP